MTESISRALTILSRTNPPAAEKVREAIAFNNLVVIGQIALIVGIMLMILICTRGRDVAAKREFLSNPITLGVISGCLLASTLMIIFANRDLRKTVADALRDKQIQEIQLSNR